MDEITPLDVVVKVDSEDVCGGCSVSVIGRQDIKWLGVEEIGGASSVFQGIPEIEFTLGGVSGRFDNRESSVCVSNFDDGLVGSCGKVEAGVDLINLADLRGFGGIGGNGKGQLMKTIVAYVSTLAEHLPRPVRRQNGLSGGRRVVEG